MDTLTHIALGACIGEAALKKAGKKALFLGAIAQSVPDIDVMAALWLPQSDNLLAHRGLTHSFLFILPAAFLLTFLFRWLFKLQHIPWLRIFLFFGFQMLVHDLLDTCNAYGTGLLEPFSAQRFSFHLLYVADPFFSLPIIAALIALLIMKLTSRHRRKWLVVAFIPAILYLSYAVYNKAEIGEDVKRELTEDKVLHTRVIVTPTPFNTWLWFVIAATDSGYYVGNRSNFDTHPIKSQLTYFPKNDSLLKGFQHTYNTKKLFSFADDVYTIEKREDSLIMNVLRFGQIAGWQDPKAPFVFQYVLNDTNNDLFVMQRGRFKGWNQNTVRKLISRIQGNR